MHVVCQVVRWNGCQKNPFNTILLASVDSSFSVLRELVTFSSPAVLHQNVHDFFFHIYRRRLCFARPPLLTTPLVSSVCTARVTAGVESHFRVSHAYTPFREQPPQCLSRSGVSNTHEKERTVFLLLSLFSRAPLQRNHVFRHVQEAQAHLPPSSPRSSTTPSRTYPKAAATRYTHARAHHLFLPFSLSLSCTRFTPDFIQNGRVPSVRRCIQKKYYSYGTRANTPPPPFFVFKPPPPHQPTTVCLIQPSLSLPLIMRAGPGELRQVSGGDAHHHVRRR